MYMELSSKDLCNSSQMSSPVMVSLTSPPFCSLPVYFPCPLAATGVTFPLLQAPVVPVTPPHPISSLHLSPSTRILVIFCVVCFGSGSVSHHSHLMAGCSQAHRVVSPDVRQPGHTIVLFISLIDAPAVAIPPMHYFESGTQQ